MASKLTRGHIFWLKHIDLYGNLMVVAPAPDCDHMGHSPSIDDILTIRPDRPCLVRQTYDGDLELTPAGRAALSGAS